MPKGEEPRKPDRSKPEVDRSKRRPDDPEEVEEVIDESVEESFPASDPPAHKSSGTKKR